MALFLPSSSSTLFLSLPPHRPLPKSTYAFSHSSSAAAAAAAASSSSRPLYVQALPLNFAGSVVESGAGAGAVEEKKEPHCPAGLRQYETMAVLRPDISEDERLALVQRYEELLVAGGGMYIEVFNRGVIPLAYSIKKKNKAGETNTYLDGIYLLFTYFTRPESIDVLESRLSADDDVVRSSSLKIRKRKY
ncbi:small ribosomal subunit protein bS6c alpha-like [Typha angustifolia]|uniref:small ribosomal subunit protein bS6c alpha-like n=1 Tax=Typha angustifolia TaxID=59011 RepID=UPI003C2C9650